MVFWRVAPCGFFSRIAVLQISLLPLFPGDFTGYIIRCPEYAPSFWKHWYLSTRVAFHITEDESLVTLHIT